MLPRQETVDEILSAPPPKTMKQLRAFLGLASFYRKYVLNFGVIAAPLTDANKICWNENWEHALQELNKQISQQSIFRLPDTYKSFKTFAVHCSAL